MFNFGTQELVLVLIIALVVFGPGKLPEIGKAIGKSINEFKDAVSGTKDKVEEVAEKAKVDTIKAEPLAKNLNTHKETKDAVEDAESKNDSESKLNS